MKISPATVQEMISKILASKKYRHAGLNQDTIEALIQKEAPQHTSHKQIMKAVRTKLHNIVAPYLGEPDYVSLTQELHQIDDYSLDAPQLLKFCHNVLSQHASTAERMPLMPDFYTQLFSVTGQPDSILDLACGLHPLGFPWMGLPNTVQYHAYDILQPRIDFINSFFNKLGLAPLAENRDILINPPTQQADLGIFFKEAHRFEKRQPGCNRAFWESLNVATLAVSLPTKSLTGSHHLLDSHRNLVHENLPQHRKISEIKIGNEIIFLIKKKAD